MRAASRRVFLLAVIFSGLWVVGCGGSPAPRDSAGAPPPTSSGVKKAKVPKVLPPEDTDEKSTKIFPYELNKGYKSPPVLPTVAPESGTTLVKVYYATDRSPLDAGLWQRGKRAGWPSLAIGLGLTGAGMLAWGWRQGRHARRRKSPALTEGDGACPAYHVNDNGTVRLDASRNLPSTKLGTTSEDMVMAVLVEEPVAVSTPDDIIMAWPVD